MRAFHRHQRWSLWCGMLLLVLMMVSTACGENPQQLYETAQFEERQLNLAHARELYARIIQDHPDSPYAKLARERLAELGRTNE